MTAWALGPGARAAVVADRSALSFPNIVQLFSAWRHTIKVQNVRKAFCRGSGEGLAQLNRLLHVWEQSRPLRSLYLLSKDFGHEVR
jgi:hypothetical protein